MFRHGRRQRFSLFFFVAFCWDHRDEFSILRRFYATRVYLFPQMEVSGPPFLFERYRHRDANAGNLSSRHVRITRFFRCARMPAYSRSRECFSSCVCTVFSPVVARSTSGGADESTRHVLFLGMGSQLPVCRWLQRLSLRRLFSVASAASDLNAFLAGTAMTRAGGSRFWATDHPAQIGARRIVHRAASRQGQYLSKIPHHIYLLIWATLLRSATLRTASICQVSVVFEGFLEVSQTLPVRYHRSCLATCGSSTRHDRALLG